MKLFSLFEKYFLFTLLSSLSVTVFSQAPDHHSIKGTVYGIDNNKREPLIGAAVYWLETSDGVATDFDGKFTLHAKGNE